ncbi:uncharacterized protein (TIGR03083 family) [Murinocardiopsis flavida]|uniref:Uncharacterized protein (TIGR03083 family) n=1 Tax=Murinocardiopsis flavida TaxID=645275 RepID=A0A2P8DSS7_9ACTN|nr:maleylpyruvate isomerase family mycothiol-dependent enzyme [Murinocardiopsis flavida]PSL00261.1 uncharacterized protein (TIGR03083 family) [Murinocardiopsis flavida]
MDAPLGPAIDTRPLYPRERAALLDLLRSLTPPEWAAATVCPGWDVHDLAAHIACDYLRRLSGSRDGHAGAVFEPDDTLPTFLARTNEESVRALRQCSPAVLIDLIAHFGPQLDALWSGRDPHGPADLDVSWAGSPERPSPAWLDIARDYTEFWVHQQQIRDAVSRPGADGPELMRPVVDTFLRALPHTLRGEERPPGTAVRFEVEGPAGGTWEAVHGPGGWRLRPPAGAADAAARVVLDQDSLWRLASRGITVEEAGRRAAVSGDPALARAAASLLAIVW